MRLQPRKFNIEFFSLASFTTQDTYNNNILHRVRKKVQETS